MVSLNKCASHGLASAHRSPLEIVTGLLGRIMPAMPKRYDIKAGELQLHGSPEKMLESVHQYVETEIIKARDWYFLSKTSKKRLSQVVRYFAITLSAAAGILPMVMAMWPKALDQIPVLSRIKPENSSNLAISLLAALATALIALDRFGGFS